MTKEEMVGWHHRLNGHEFEHTPGNMKDREAWCAAGREVAESYDLVTEQQEFKEAKVFA